MRIARSLLVKAIALLGLIAVFGSAFTEHKGASLGSLDVRALLLVFIAPLLILVFFQKDSIPLGLMVSRFRETLMKSNQDVASDLEKATPLVRGQFGYSHLVKFSENQGDSMVRYAGEIYSARFSSDELARLLAQRIETEDSYWRSAYSAFGFLAKMAPYFGMMATVIGMIRLLENMSDFSHISSSMALAMQGTLYGLMSFLIVYSPLQRFFMELRNQILKRNEMIARWYVMVAEQADPTYIESELKTSEIGLRTERLESKISPAPSTRGSS